MAKIPPHEFQAQAIKNLFKRLNPTADPEGVDFASEVDATLSMEENIRLFALRYPEYDWGVEIQSNPLVERLREDIETARSVGISDRQIVVALRRSGLQLERPTSEGLATARRDLQRVKDELEAERQRARQVAEATRPPPPPDDIIDVLNLSGEQLDQLFALLPNRGALVEGVGLLPKALYFYSPSSGKLLIKADSIFVNITTATLVSRIESTISDSATMGVVAERPLTPEQINILASDFATIIRANFGRDPFPIELDQFDKLAEDLQTAGLPFTSSSERVKALAETIVRGQFERRGIARPLATPMGPTRAIGKEARRRRLETLLNEQVEKAGRLTPEEEAELEGLLFELGTDVIAEQRKQEEEFLSEVRWAVKVEETGVLMRYIEEQAARDHAEKLNRLGLHAKVVSIGELGQNGLE